MRVSLLLAPWLLLAALGAEPASAFDGLRAPAAPSLVVAAQAKLFHGVGVVLGVDKDAGVVTIDHEAIPGLMDAMVMNYNVSPKTLAAGLQKNDRVEFDVDGVTYTIVKIAKANKAP